MYVISVYIFYYTLFIFFFFIHCEINFANIFAGKCYYLFDDITISNNGIICDQGLFNLIFILSLNSRLVKATDYSEGGKINEKNKWKLFSNDRTVAADILILSS